MLGPIRRIGHKCENLETKGVIDEEVIMIFNQWTTILQEDLDEKQNIANFPGSHVGSIAGSI
jgi:hypothetical protein